MDNALSLEIAAWLQGIGTVAAVVLALFLQVFLVWLRRPRIDLQISLDAPDQDLVAVSHERREQYVCWLRARLYVRDGTDSLMGTEIVIQDWRSPAGQDAPFAHGNTLRWANSDQELVRIPSGTWRRVDVITWIADRSRPSEPVLWIALRDARSYPPPHWFQLTAPGAYELDLVVVAENMRSSRWTFGFTYAPTLVESLDDLRGTVRDVRLRRK